MIAVQEAVTVKMTAKVMEVLADLQYKKMDMMLVSPSVWSSLQHCFGTDDMSIILMKYTKLFKHFQE